MACADASRHMLVFGGGDTDAAAGSRSSSKIKMYTRVLKTPVFEWGKHWNDGGIMLNDIIKRGEKPTQIRNRQRCMGLGVTEQLVGWLRYNFGFDCVVDPFCGAGTVLAV